MKRIVPVCLAIIWVWSTATAAEIDPRLPHDTEVVVTIDLDSLMNSALGKKYLRTTVTEAIKSNLLGAEILKHLHLNPQTDFRRLTLAMSAIGSDSSTVIVQGKFDPSKIAERAAKSAGEHPERFKIHRSDDRVIYELASESPVFATLANETTLLLATRREQLTGAGKSGKPRAELLDLIARANDKHAIWFVALPAATQVIPGTNNDQRVTFEKLTGIVGSLHVTTSATFEIQLLAPDVKTANDTHKIIIDLFDSLKQLGRDIVKEKPELAPVFEILGSTRTEVRNKSVTLTAVIRAEQIEAWLKSLPEP